MKKMIVVLFIITGVLTFIVNMSKNNYNFDSNVPVNDFYDNNNFNYSFEEESSMTERIKIKVNNEILEVKLEQNSSSMALIEKLKQGDIIIEADDYGNFEKVGDLGFNLPTNDIRYTTKPGDLILYQGNKITIYYNTNTWSFTKLGEVIGKSQNELINILGDGPVTLVLSIN